MRSSCLLPAIVVLSSLLNSCVDGLAAVPRRAFFSSCAAAVMIPATAANARYTMNEETGDYDEVEDPTWQDAWKGRLDKAQSMSSDEVFMAARGVSNLEKREGEESMASKKRRAMSACRDASLLKKANVRDLKDCTGRVFSGEVDFMLNVIE